MITLSEAPILTDEDSFYHQAIISSVDDVIISSDRNFIIKTWNAAAEKTYKINAADAIGRRMFEIFCHQFIDTTPEQVQRVLALKNYWKGVVKVITKDGKKVFLESVITTARDTVQRKLGYVIVSRDVTPDISVKQSLKNFESILTILDESFIITDKNLKIVFMRLKGNAQKFFNSDYIVGDNALKYIPGIYNAIVKRSFQKALSGEIVNYEAVSETEPKLYFNVTYAPLKDNVGKVKNACMIIKDFTAQKEMEFLQKKKNAAEKKFNEGRKFFEDFMENTPLLAWVIDDEGYMHYMNAAYAEAFKLSKEVIGKNIFELYPKELAEEYLANNKKVIETGNAIAVIEKNRLPSETATYKIIKFPIFFKDKTMIAGWGVDISDQIAMQENLSLLNQNKNKIMSVIAHDVRAPLGTAANFLNIIIADYEVFTEEQLLNYLELLRNSISKCYSLTEELLLWARSQLQTINYKPNRLDAPAEISRVVESLIHVAADKKIKIDMQFCDANKIYCDPDMFAIALRNFISNAIKFSKTCSIIIISTTVKNEKLLISVQDTGVGFKNELAEKLLRKLNYESSFGTRGEKGAGLGLIIAKDYIERNNGEMYIESEEGKGSVFSFTIDFVAD
ncbi:MAG: PAS domain S-box protein [Parafilimonas sp.]